MSNAPRTLQFALCNEVLQPLPFHEQCKLAAELGYDGLEVAPCTLAEDPLALTDTEAMAFRQVAADHGLAIFGLHRLLVAPAGLSIVSPDEAVRRRTRDAMERYCELCTLLGGLYLVHGSANQRTAPVDAEPALLWERARECFAGAAFAARDCGVLYCIQPMAARDTDFINTVAQAARMVDEVQNPALRTMVDCGAAALAESEPLHELLSKWMPQEYIGHVQVNDPNGRGPGEGDLDFGPIMRTLLQMFDLGNFPGIVSVEPREWLPDGPTSAARSLGYLQGLVRGLRTRG